MKAPGFAGGWLLQRFMKDNQVDLSEFLECAQSDQFQKISSENAKAIRYFQETYTAKYAKRFQWLKRAAYACFYGDVVALLAIPFSPVNSWMFLLAKSVIFIFSAVLFIIILRNSYFDDRKFHKEKMGNIRKIFGNVEERKVWMYSIEKNFADFEMSLKIPEILAPEDGNKRDWFYLFLYRSMKKPLFIGWLYFFITAACFAFFMYKKTFAIIPTLVFAELGLIGFLLYFRPVLSRLFGSWSGSEHEKIIFQVRVAYRDVKRSLPKRF